MQGRTDNRQVVLAILGGAAGVALLSASVILMNGKEGTPGGSALPWTWSVPLASLFVIVGVTWLLLSQKPREPSAGARLYVSCPSCARSVMRDWRLCPYCGEVLEHREQDRAAEGT
jgi:hypothetical protein